MKAISGDGKYTKAVVYLDDVEIKWVIEADTDKGYVVVYKTKSDRFDVINDEIVKETLLGKVEIKFDE